MIHCQITLPLQQVRGALVFCIPGCGFSIFLEDASYRAYVSYMWLSLYSTSHYDMSPWPRRWEESRSGVQRGISQRVFVSQVRRRKWKMKMKEGKRNGMQGALVIGGSCCCYLWRKINNIFVQICYSGWEAGIKGEMMNLWISSVCTHMFTRAVRFCL